MIRVAHLIHTTGIGGVETAADLLSRNAKGLKYRVYALEEAETSAVSADFVGRGVNSLGSFRDMLAQLHRFRPEVVVSSLWRSVIVGGVHRLQHPRTPWVVYVHSTRYTNVVDAMVHRIAFRFADLILCDSSAALDALVPADHRSHAEVVCPDSALLHLARSHAQDEGAPTRGTTADRVGECTAEGDESREVATDLRLQSPTRLIYWGRVAEQKRLDRCLELMAALEEIAPGVFSLDLITPENRALRCLLDSAGERGLPVNWLGPAAPENIRAHAVGAPFFLQLSDFEGLAMSVREALALGLVPIVTPVGAIRHYTEDGVNAIHVANDQTRNCDDGSGGSDLTDATYARIARRIVEVNKDPVELTSLSRAARTVPGNDFVAEFETAVLAVRNRDFAPRRKVTK